VAGTILQPVDRYAFVGKTGSGKTALAMVVAGLFARGLSSPWEVWWLDTKNDPDDIKALRSWGFRNAASDSDMQSEGAIRGAKYFRIDGSDEKFNVETVDQAQKLIGIAYKRQYTIIVIDEYTQVCPSQRTAGRNLLNAFQRGRGRKVGVIGLTQEPVYVPRQLLSAASHLILLNLTYGIDITYVKKLVPEYTPPGKLGDSYGFYWKWVDGPTDAITYYPHQKIWYDEVKFSLPKQSIEVEQGT